METFYRQIPMRGQGFSQQENQANTYSYASVVRLNIHGERDNLACLVFLHVGGIICKLDPS